MIGLICCFAGGWILGSGLSKDDPYQSITGAGLIAIGVMIPF
jgi:hypothetical protein